MTDSTGLTASAHGRRDAEEFTAIEAAMLESDRGRWFLLEYARRQRVTETQTLLDAVARLERAVIGDTQPTAVLQAPTSPLSGDAAALARGIAAQLGDIVWTLREAGASHALCDALDAQVALLARIGEDKPGVVEKLPAPLACPGETIVPVPPLQGDGGSRSDPGGVARHADPHPNPPPFRGRESDACRARLLAGLSKLDELSFEDRLAMFA